MVDRPSSLGQLYPDTPSAGNLVPDAPVPPSDLAPLVEEMHRGYRCADLLLLLPGSIPIPSFCASPTFEAQNWVDPQTQRFRPEIVAHLTQTTLPSLTECQPALPFATVSASDLNYEHRLERMVMRAPLIVRLPAMKPSVYTPAGRSKFLSSIGIPCEYHDPRHTRILVVSFGGQIFRRPLSRPANKRSSGNRSPCRESSPPRQEGTNNNAELMTGSPASQSGKMTTADHFDNFSLNLGSDDESSTSSGPIMTSPRLATPSHLWFPGAPPVTRVPSLPASPQPKAHSKFAMTLLAPTPLLDQGGNAFPSAVEDEGPFLLPDASWIAVVCGVSREQWNGLGCDVELPDGFFIAPRYVYMPDLMAVADVLLGKLVRLSLTCTLQSVNSRS